MKALNPKLVAYVLDPLERAAKTFVQQLLVTLLAIDGAGHLGILVQQNWLLALDAAGFAAAMSILTSVLTFKVPPLNAYADLALRVVKTFLQSFVGTVAAANVLSLTHVDWRGALALALPVAGSALLTGIAALGIPQTSGASLLPAGTAVAQEAPGDGQVDDADVFPPYDPNLPVQPLEPHETAALDR